MHKYLHLAVHKSKHDIKSRERLYDNVFVVKISFSGKLIQVSSDGMEWNGTVSRHTQSAATATAEPPSYQTFKLYSIGSTLNTAKTFPASFAGCGMCLCYVTHS